MHDNINPKAMCLESCDLFKLWEISNNITFKMQNRGIIAMEL